mmetsp:Transcript_56697/g.118544  ORF Transcript_56697/g.118544 Transcript_56697/m.118544 type:complete len:213 (-) Transcript_56697:324-962(-)
MHTSIVADVQSIFTVGRNAPANIKTPQVERNVIPPLMCAASFPEPIMTLKPIVTMNPSVADQVRCSVAEKFCQTNQRTKLQMQTQQIDGAIHLLKMQYEAIMSNVRKNQEPANLQDRQFDLPRPDWTIACMGQNLPRGQYNSNVKEGSVPDSGSAHRKRAAEDVLNDDSSKKRSISSSGKLVLDSEVPFFLFLISSCGCVSDLVSTDSLRNL